MGTLGRLLRQRTSAGLHLRPCQRDLVDFKLRFLQEEDKQGTTFCTSLQRRDEDAHAGAIFLA